MDAAEAITREEALELIAEQLLKASEDIAFFASFVQTLDRDKNKSYLRPFPIHKPYIRKLLKIAGKHTRLAVYKSRQMVVTWCMLLVCLHEFMFKPGSIISVVSMTEKDAGKLLDKIYLMYTSLPAHWKIGLPTIRTYNGKGGIIVRMVATFGDDEPPATVEACATNGNPGRGQTLSLCYWDEIGEQKDDECRHMYSALRPTLEGGGRLLMSSTPPRSPEHFWNQFCSDEYFRQ
jgi:hypothetical protein